MHPPYYLMPHHRQPQKPNQIEKCAQRNKCYQWDHGVLFLSEPFSLSVVSDNTDKWVTSISRYGKSQAERQNKCVFFPTKLFFFIFIPHLQIHCWMVNCTRRVCGADVLFCVFFFCVQPNCRRGATVHFSCDEGYELQGSKSITCLRVTDSYVGWSDDRPICRGKDWRVLFIFSPV